MKRTGLFGSLMAALSGDGLLHETPGPGTGGGPAAGGAPPPDASVSDHVSGGPDATGDDRPLDADGGDPNPDADADLELEPDDAEDLSAHVPEPKLRTRHRSLQRAMQKARPVLDKLRDPSTGNYLPPERVDQMIADSREFSRIDQVLSRSPRAVQVLMEEDARLRNGQGDQAVDEPDEPFNETDFPFDAATPEGQYMLNLAKQAHGQAAYIKRLEKQVNGVGQRLETDTLAATESTWKSQTIQAAQELPTEFRGMFIRGVKREFDLLKTSKRLNQSDVKRIIDSELKEFRATKKTAARQTTNRQSAMVAGNATLPKTPRPGTTTPAPGGKGTSTTRETIKDASKSFLGRYRS